MRRQSGLALLEVMLALLLVSAGVAGCLQYQQWMARGQVRQQQERQLWQTASQLLDACAAGMAAEEVVRTLAPPEQWQWRAFRQPEADGCARLTVEITAPLNLNARLERIVCPRV